MFSTLNLNSRPQTSGALQLTTEDFLSFLVQVGYSDARSQDGIVWVFGGQSSSDLSSQGVQLYCGDAAVKALNDLHGDLSLQKTFRLGSGLYISVLHRFFLKLTRRYSV